MGIQKVAREQACLDRLAEYINSPRSEYRGPWNSDVCEDLRSSIISGAVLESDGVPDIWTDRWGIELFIASSHQEDERTNRDHEFANNSGDIPLIFSGYGMAAITQEHFERENPGSTPPPPPDIQGIRDNLRSSIKRSLEKHAQKTWRYRDSMNLRGYDPEKLAFLVELDMPMRSAQEGAVPRFICRDECGGPAKHMHEEFYDWEDDPYVLWHLAHLPSSVKVVVVTEVDHPNRTVTEVVFFDVDMLRDRFHGTELNSGPYIVQSIREKPNATSFGDFLRR